MPMKTGTWTRKAPAVLIPVILAVLTLAGCGSTARGGSTAASASALASSQAGKEAEGDARQLAAACTPKNTAGKPVADPVATLLSSSDARHAWIRCEEIPRHAWPKGLSCLLTWGGKARAAFKADPGANPAQRRDTLALRVLDYCGLYAKGQHPKEPVFS
jgi:outer membrane murein-binding lipoprotein Lpp